jgi:hypothetical protein
MNNSPKDINSIRKQFNESIDQVKSMGIKALKSGEWLMPLIQKSFKAYYDNASAEYFCNKYPGLSDEKIIKKLISVCARNASILGGVTGAAVSANEISALIGTATTGGLNLPAQISIAVGALGAEALLLIRFQIKLIAEIAKVLKVPLNPNDPEDVLLVLGFAIGGSGAEVLGKASAKAAGHLTKVGVKKYIGGTTLKALKRFAAMLGQDLLQRSILKYTVPGASIAVGALWNYATTKVVGKVAIKHFVNTRKEREGTPSASHKKVRKPLKKGIIQCENSDEYYGENWWEVLGVNINASKKEVNDAYKKQVAKSRPKKTGPVSNRTTKQRVKRLGKIKNAYNEAIAAIDKRNK